MINVAADQMTEFLLQNALTQRASDIHLESYEHIGWVRFRIDGVLKKVLELNSEPWQQLLSRFKILARLDIAERRLPQDGHFIFRHAGQEYDCRLSCCPVAYGEKLVIRILNPLAGIPAINELGLTNKDVLKVLEVLKSSQGMMLVTGPTGSGKTLSLYTFLQEINTGKRNISTIEDPIEIKFTGINQTEVNAKIDLTFARVLRSLLRQDPDVIMVGEIRDLETARIAVQAAYTGHLVLSTLHTNSAAATVIRLIDMGLPILNVVSALKLVIAQRLVRVLCPHCRKPYTLTLEEQASYKELAASTVYEASLAGCEHCNKCGYNGRTAIFELLVFDEGLRRFILDHNQLSQLDEYLKSRGHQDLRYQGLEAVRLGITSLSEFQRVAY